MEIGKEEPAIIVEPVKDPFRKETPAPAREKPEPVPVKQPAKTSAA
jgi:hypothetical protein